MNKFDYTNFIIEDCGQVIAFNARRYTRETAYPIARIELDANNNEEIICSDAWCYYGYGVYSDETPGHGYWLTTDKKKNSFPVLVFSIKGHEWP